MTEPKTVSTKTVSSRVIIFFEVCAFLTIGMAHAQFGRGNGDWSTAGGDAHRSSWVPSDPKISRASMSKPGFAIVWKMKWGQQPLTTPVLLNGYIGYRGFRSLAFVGGRSDTVYAMDTDLGRMEWQKHFAVAAPQAPSDACTGGMTANVARAATTAFPVAPPESAGGGGRSRAARSDVGQPDQGAAILAAMEEQARRAAATPPGRGGQSAPPTRRLPNVVYALASDGMLHAMYVSNGEEPELPVQFLPRSGDAVALTVIGETVYAVVAPHCGIESGVWALDLPTKHVTHWAPDGGVVNYWFGPAFGGDGDLFVVSTAGTTGMIAALDSKTLAPKDAYVVKGQSFTYDVSLQYKEKTLIAATSNDGRIHLLDAGNLSGPPIFVSNPDMGFGALAAWAQSDGTHWLLSTSARGVRAMKIVEKDSALSLESAWVSREMSPALRPIVINGVVFAASESLVLYSLDGVSGKELWNSGKTIESPIHNGTLSGGGGQLYLTAQDGTLYVFGFPIEH